MPGGQLSQNLFHQAVDEDQIVEDEDDEATEIN